MFNFFLSYLNSDTSEDLHEFRPNHSRHHNQQEIQLTQINVHKNKATAYTQAQNYGGKYNQFVIIHQNNLKGLMTLKFRFFKNKNFYTLRNF